MLILEMGDTLWHQNLIYCDEILEHMFDTDHPLQRLVTVFATLDIVKQEIRGKSKEQRPCNKVEKMTAHVVLDIGCGKKPRGNINIDMVRTEFCNFVASAEQLPFHDDSIETIFCSHVLEHLDHPRRALKEINRILTADGIAYISFPKPEFGNTSKLRLFEFFLNLPFSLFPIPIKSLSETLRGTQRRKPTTYHKFILTPEYVAKNLIVTSVEGSNDILFQALDTSGITRFIRKPHVNTGVKLLCKKLLRK